ncbi:MAG: hypothetical protein V3571_15560 [Pseudodesulfovibrio sp.]
MGKRLEITVFGTLYRLGVLRISRAMAKSGMRTYGGREWNEIMSDIALSLSRPNLLSEVQHTLGHEMPVPYRADGVAMQAAFFGLEMFHGGRPLEVDVVEAANKTLDPGRMLQGAGKGELLGVFWARREGALFFRWDDVDEARGEQVTMVYDRVHRLLNRKGVFDLVTDITWDGRRGRRRGGESLEGFERLKPVFHLVE